MIVSYILSCIDPVSMGNVMSANTEESDISTSEGTLYMNEMNFTGHQLLILISLELLPSVNFRNRLIVVKNRLISINRIDN